MVTDELYRAVHALVACKGLTEVQALEHLLEMGQERRRAISDSLKAWSICEPEDERSRDDIEERIHALERDLTRIWLDSQDEAPEREVVAGA